MLLTVDPSADLLVESERIVNYYYQVESDIKRLCDPYFREVTHDDITMAQQRAALAVEQFLPVCSLTAHLLANMYFENTYTG